MCGLVGTLSVGLFALRLVNFSGNHKGLPLGGGVHQLAVQALAVLVTIVWAFALTYALARVTKRTVGLRVDQEQEVEGLDISVHAETAYDIGALRTSGRS